MKTFSSSSTVAELLAEAIPARLITYPAELLQACKESHAEGPVLGCPVCFVYLCHGQALVEFCHELLSGVVRARQAEGKPRDEQITRALEHFSRMDELALFHVQPGKGGVQ